MQNIWSENKKVNTLVNILLFLMATNFLHYGIVILPIICVILFVDNKCSFKVNNKMTFIILCLFGITFLAFSYKLGFYSFIGLFLPMAYYIGSNIKTVNEDNIKHIIYLLTLGMCVHVILNFGIDLILRGLDIFRRNTHLDIWTLNEYPTTQTSILYIFVIGIIYYVLIYERNIMFKKSIIASFILLMIYEIALGRRTPILILGIAVYASMCVDYFIFKNKNKFMRTIIIITVICSLIVLGIFVVLKFNLVDIDKLLQKASLLRKFYFFGFESGRLIIFRQALELAPSHLFGGKEISAIIEWDIHDLWFDTFDYAGIVPFVVLVINSIMSIFTFVRFYKNNNISRNFKFFISSLYGVIIFQMFIEPIMTGSSIFLLCSIVVFALIERLTIIVYNK